ncbi:MAG TPA: hypothetical protein VMH87_17935 [Pseudomonadales bacterium]|nr:hypothetical protein [Pseudomonadales bacterium]
MSPRILEQFVYILVIVLSLVALGLVTLAPGFMDTQVVYQGF